MPKTAAQHPLTIAKNARIEYIDGAAFVPLREAARLSKVHPVALEMGKRLLARPNDTGASFLLGDAAMKLRALEIESVFVKGLRRVVRVLGNGKKYRVRSYRNGDRLVFWVDS